MGDKKLNNARQSNILPRDSPGEVTTCFLQVHVELSSAVELAKNRFPESAKSLYRVVFLTGPP